MKVSRWPRVDPAIGFVAPALVLLALFFVLPVAAGLVLSFTDFDIYALGDVNRLRWIGFDNYRRLWNDPLVARAVGNTLYFTLVGGTLSVLCSLGAALLLTRPRLPGLALWRTALFLPVVTSLVAVAVVWRYLYHPLYGALNHVIAWVGFEPIDWLGDARTAMPAILLLAVWKNFGFNMVIFIAGLQSIPARLYEAAELDGAGRWAQFRHVTLPMLAPTLAFVAIVTLIGHLQVFAEPYVMTQGGPADATLTVALLMYREGFRWWNLGYASALALLLFALILIGTGLQAGLRQRGSRP
jgi:multiple sugar transport system permease protein